MVENLHLANLNAILNVSSDEVTALQAEFKLALKSDGYYALLHFLYVLKFGSDWFCFLEQND